MRWFRLCRRSGRSAQRRRTRSTPPRSAAPLIAALILIGQATIAHSRPADDASRAKGASFSIDRYSIDGGVGYANGGAYSVSGTAGQADADSLGPASGGVYSVTGGIWPGSTAPEQPDALHADGFE